MFVLGVRECGIFTITVLKIQILHTGANNASEKIFLHDLSQTPMKSFSTAISAKTTAYRVRFNCPPPFLTFSCDWYVPFILYGYYLNYAGHQNRE